MEAFLKLIILLLLATQYLLASECRLINGTYKSESSPETKTFIQSDCNSIIIRSSHFSNDIGNTYLLDGITRRIKNYSFAQREYITNSAHNIKNGVAIVKNDEKTMFETSKDGHKLLETTPSGEQNIFTRVSPQEIQTYVGSANRCTDYSGTYEGSDLTIEIESIDCNTFKIHLKGDQSNWILDGSVRVALFGNEETESGENYQFSARVSNGLFRSTGTSYIDPKTKEVYSVELTEERLEFSPNLNIMTYKLRFLTDRVSYPSSLLTLTNKLLRQ